MRSSLRSPRLWIGMAVSVLALVLATRGVSWSKVAAELGGASYGWLLPTVGVIALGQVARAVRWQALFGRGPRPDLYHAFAILSVGYLVNNVLPLRLGDFVRAWLVGSTTAARPTEALATVVVERVVDLLTIVGCVAVMVPQPTAALLADRLGEGPWADPQVLRLVILALLLGIYLVLVLLAVAAAPVRRVLERVLPRLGLGAERADKVAELAGRFLLALGALRRPRTAALVLAWSVLIWLIGGLQYWTVMRAFHLDLPFSTAMFVLGATALFAILPSSPGYVGVFQFAIQVSLPAIAPAVSADTTLSYALVLHAVTFATLVGLGVVGLLMLGVSFGDVMRRAQPDQLAV
jgi:uncharacterized protein (TIRG00374 family)